MSPDLIKTPKDEREDPTSDTHTQEEKLREAVGLAQAIDLNVEHASIVRIKTPKPGTLFGLGKVDELRKLVEETDSEVVIVDHPLTPVQQKNLEEKWNAKVLDRTGLILEIFGARARTREGQLQVELAHLTYQKGRLVRAWSHLERQRGGGGFVGGPGEAQIELDRRMISTRIEAIKKDLAQVVKTRELHRRGRRKVPYPIVAVVGYTNAGKSTLFNRLTGANVTAENQVFATLDPTMREVRLSSGRRIILSDTVGFISNLPTMLVAAFRATLEEVIEADLILHVRNISANNTDAQCRDVENVLGNLGIDLGSENRPILEIWNKIDKLSPVTLEEAAAAAGWASQQPVLISALNGDGIDELLTQIDSRLGEQDLTLDLVIAPTEGKLLHWLHQNASVLERCQNDNGEILLRVRIAGEKHGRLLAQLEQERAS